MLCITFRSSVGKINAMYHHNRNAVAPVAIIVSGSVIDEKISDSNFSNAMNKITEAFIENGFSTLQFNFRHTNSEEKKDNPSDDINNLLDLTAALDWLHTKNIESKNFWICGLDSGYITALQLVMRRPEIENYILVSPNIKKNDLNFIVPCTASGLLVRASEDLRFLEEDCINLQEKLVTKTESKIKYITIYRAERDYGTELEQLKTEINTYIKEKNLKDYQNLKSISINKRRRRKKRISDNDDEKIIYTNPIKPLDIDNI